VTTVDDPPEVAAKPRAAPPSVRRERMEPLNLARRPFLNSRPVVRVSLLLWVLGLLILLGNVSLFWGYLGSSADKRQQITRGEQEIARQQRTAAELQRRLDSLDLVRLNEQVDFLNEKIEERTFSWSLLLDRLAEVLPNEVRLIRLAPQMENQGESRRTQASRRAPQREGQIPLSITAESRNDEALHRFVDNLFDPPFEDPNLMREERLENNLVRFELSVQYIPGDTPKGPAVATPTIEEAPAAASPTPDAPPSGGPR
jgi:Tfp pilus assembly protein PilN